MRIRISALALALAATLCGQSKFSWQDYCFKNPGAPVCPGHDYAIKKTPPPRPAAATRSVITTPSSAPARTAAPALIVVGAIDWRFADPYPDALIGLNFNELSASPLARNLISQLGAQQGLATQDLQKIFDGLSDLDQVAMSIRNNHVVVMITGRVTDGALPPAEAGMKVAPISGNAMLVGHVDAVDDALRRMAMKTGPSELTRLAEQRQASAEFWAIGSPGLVGPQAAGTGLKRFFLTVSIRDRFSSDVAFEFNGLPPANTVKALQTSLGALSVEGNTAHIRMSMEAAEVQQKFGQIATSAVGQRLATLVAAARYLPARDTMVPKQTKPVIYGLDGGPKEVNQ